MISLYQTGGIARLATKNFALMVFVGRTREEGSAGPGLTNPVRCAFQGSNSPPPRRILDLRKGQKRACVPACESHELDLTMPRVLCGPMTRVLDSTR